MRIILSMYLKNLSNGAQCLKHSRNSFIPISSSPSSVNVAANFHHTSFDNANFQGNVSIQKSHLELTVSSEAAPMQLNYMWLRDNCRCNECHNHTTNQRILNVLEIPSDIQPTKCLVEKDKLQITWHDGHQSCYLVEWLQHTNHGFYWKNKQARKPVIWNKDGITSHVAQVDVAQFSESESALKCVIKSIVDFGVGIVKNVSPTVEATEQVAARISHWQRTFFGDMWVVGNDLVHKDTAYSSEFIGAHTDNTYFTEAPGLQVFHCLHHDGTGGENLLVDGFRAGHDMKQKHAESYYRLTQTPIESHYLELGRHYSSIDTVLRLHKVTKELEQVRFNLLDRAPLTTLSNDQVPQFYEDLRKLAAIIADPQGEWWLKLSPGTVLFIDNWRVLHGRAAFTGQRKLTGCYIARSDFCSKARVLGLI